MAIKVFMECSDDSCNETLELDADTDDHIEILMNQDGWGTAEDGRSPLCEYHHDELVESGE